VIFKFITQAHKALINFASRILQLYAQNGRDLPWRKYADPYAVWVSEIILQQTRVSQGMQYYYNFLSKVPAVSHLAHAEPDQLLKVREGLGYCNRAINMQKSAAIIYQIYSSKFPATYEDWLELPGVGTYTAAAIVSAVFNQPVAAIDTIGYRVISRLYAVSPDIPVAQRKKQVQKMARQSNVRKRFFYFKFFKKVHMQNQLSYIFLLYCRRKTPLFIHLKTYKQWQE